MIEKLKALEAAATPGPWVQGGHGDPVPPHGFRKPLIFERNLGDVPIQSTEYHSNLLLTEALRNLAPELIALWEAVPRVLGDHVDCPDCSRSFIPEDPAHLELFNAYKALNAKAAEVLK